MYPDRNYLAHQPRHLPEDDAILSRNLQRINLPRLTLLVLVILTSRFVYYAEGQSLNGAQVVREANQIDLASNEPRPLKAVIVALTEELGWTVDYEDPPYSKSSPDVSDLTDPNWKAGHPNDLFFGLKGGSFRTHLSAGETASAFASPSIVERIVTGYNERSLAGHFAVRTEIGGRMVAVGIATRNSSGEYQPSRVILDSSLELNPATVDLQDALADFTPRCRESRVTRSQSAQYRSIYFTKPSASCRSGG